MFRKNRDATNSMKFHQSQEEDAEQARTIASKNVKSTPHFTNTQKEFARETKPQLSNKDWEAIANPPL